MQGRLFLRGLRFFGYHGAVAAERTLGQVFQVDLEVATSVLGRAARSDSLQDTLDYVKLYEIVQEVVQGPPRNLVETLALDIIQRVFQSFQDAEEVSCAVHKPAISIPGKVDQGSIGVQFTRKRQALCSSNSAATPC
jgi:dihydroneopterin aldolase